MDEGVCAFLANFTALCALKEDDEFGFFWPIALCCLISPNSADDKGSTASNHPPTIRLDLSDFSTMKVMFNNH